MSENIQPQVRIRPAKEEDLEEVCNIERKSFPTSWPKSSFKYLLIQESNIFLVALKEGETVAYAIATVENNFSFNRIFERKGHLLKLAVDEMMRGQGIGSFLLRSLIEKLKGKGIDRIKLETRVQNYKARRFYKQHGFMGRELVKSYYPDGEDAVLMEKEID